MKYLLALAVFFISCSNKSEKNIYNYQFIKTEVEELDLLVFLKRTEYKRKKDTINLEGIKKLHQDIFDTFVEFRFIVESQDNQNEEKLYDMMDSVFMDISPTCFKEIGKLERVPLTDTMYFHNMKFEYIKCILKNSQYYDSIPGLRKRIEDSEKEGYVPKSSRVEE